MATSQRIIVTGTANNPPPPNTPSYTAPAISQSNLASGSGLNALASTQGFGYNSSKPGYSITGGGTSEPNYSASPQASTPAVSPSLIPSQETRNIQQVQTLTQAQPDLNQSFFLVPIQPRESAYKYTGQPPTDVNNLNPEYNRDITFFTNPLNKGTKSDRANQYNYQTTPFQVQEQSKNYLFASQGIEYKGQPVETLPGLVFDKQFKEAQAKYFFSVDSQGNPKNTEDFGQYQSHFISNFGSQQLPALNEKVNALKDIDRSIYVSQAQANLRGYKPLIIAGELGAFAVATSVLPGTANAFIGYGSALLSEQQILTSFQTRDIPKPLYQNLLTAGEIAVGFGVAGALVKPLFPQTKTIGLLDYIPRYKNVQVEGVPVSEGLFLGTGKRLITDTAYGFNKEGGLKYQFQIGNKGNVAFPESAMQSMYRPSGKIETGLYMSYAKSYLPQDYENILSPLLKMDQNLKGVYGVNYEQSVFNTKSYTTGLTPKEQTLFKNVVQERTTGDLMFTKNPDYYFYGSSTYKQQIKNAQFTPNDFDIQTKQTTNEFAQKVFGELKTGGNAKAFSITEGQIEITKPGIFTGKLTDIHKAGENEAVANSFGLGGPQFKHIGPDVATTLGTSIQGNIDSIGQFSREFVKVTKLEPYSETGTQITKDIYNQLPFRTPQGTIAPNLERRSKDFARGYMMRQEAITQVAKSKQPALMVELEKFKAGALEKFGPDIFNSGYDITPTGLDITTKPNVNYRADIGKRVTSLASIPYPTSESKGIKYKTSTEIITSPSLQRTFKINSPSLSSSSLSPSISPSISSRGYASSSLSPRISPSISVSQSPSASISSSLSVSPSASPSSSLSPSLSPSMSPSYNFFPSTIPGFPLGNPGSPDIDRYFNKKFRGGKITNKRTPSQLAIFFDIRSNKAGSFEKTKFGTSNLDFRPILTASKRYKV